MTCEARTLGTKPGAFSSRVRVSAAARSSQKVAAQHFGADGKLLALDAATPGAAAPNPAHTASTVGTHRPCWLSRRRAGLFRGGV